MVLMTMIKFLTRKHHLAVFFAIAIVICGSFYSCKNERSLILYDKEFKTVEDIAKKQNKVFCIVLTRPDCPPCEVYIQNLGERYNLLAPKAVFNIVNVSLPENQWYQHWICSGASPTTCIFSPEGQLIAVVSGVKASAMQCIESAIVDDAACSTYFYEKHYPEKSDAIPMLNALLSCKWQLDRGEDISFEIQAYLGKKAYPYPVYLKCLNEEKQGRHEEAVYWAKRLLTQAFGSDMYYSRVYNNIYGEMKSILDPGYTPDTDAVLSVVNELRLDSCPLHQPVSFNLELTNTGKSPLTIRDIGLSCDCIKLLSENTLSLMPGESKKVYFTFTSETQGEVYRDITLFSDAINSIEMVQVVAVVN